MFSYYGSKSKIVHLYPPAKYGRIIEPFAGSARYSLRYFDRDVLLIDKYPVIVDIWRYLQQASPQDILGLPKMKPGESTHDYNFDCLQAKWLMGFLIQQGTRNIKYTVSSVGNFGACVERDKKRIAKALYKIRHWKIQLGDYTDAPDVEATWFIDPPYVKGGEHYVKSSKQLDFAALGAWCKTRKGQTIVCENSAADWLPFERLARMRGSVRATTEVFWTNERVPMQAQLFENLADSASQA